MEAGTTNEENYVPGFDEDKNMTFKEGIVKKQLEEINLLVVKGQYDEALALMEGQLPTLQSFEERFVNDDKRSFIIFYEPFQQVLYQYLYKPTITIEPLPTLGIEANLLHGSILVGLHKYEDALKCFEKALTWNPVEPRAIYQRIELFKLMKDILKVCFHFNGNQMFPIFLELLFSL